MSYADDKWVIDMHGTPSIEGMANLASGEAVRRRIRKRWERRRADSSGRSELWIRKVDMKGAMWGYGPTWIERQGTAEEAWESPQRAYIKLIQPR